MMRSSSAAKAAALSVAVAAHGALALALTAPEPARIEGADGAAEVRLGNAFQDMAAGTLSAERTDTMADESSLETATVEQAERNDAERAEPLPPVAERTTPPAGAEKLRPVAPSAETMAERPQIVEPEVARAPAVPNGTLAPIPLETVPAERPEAPAAQAPRERVKGTDPGSTAVTRSPRPPPRSEEFVAAHPPVADKPVRKPAAQSAASPGNAPRDSRAGEATGSADASARQSGSGGRQQAAGNAAASNYPGLVMQELSRSKKPRVDARGAAVIAFTIAADGGLASVSLASSSGSDTLDHAAIQIVRRAGPFPRPPQGARRSFSIEIKGG